MDSLGGDLRGYNPPPVGDVGCYKGVMLCNRPPDAPGVVASGEATQAPFKTAVSAKGHEPPGLQPPKDRPKPAGMGQVKKRGPSAALRRHCQWIRELQEQVREDQVQAEEDDRMQQERRKKMADVFKRQRDAVQEVKYSKGREAVEPWEIEQILLGPQDPSAASRASAKGKSGKPLWALTEEERQDLEDGEADELIRFAEAVDFDEYINDLEFRQGLAALKDRAKRLQREQDAFKDSIVREFNGDDRDTVASSADDDHLGGKLAAREATPFRQPDWDSSTAMGENDRQGQQEARAVADRALEANPQLRGVHSKSSVRRLVERASERGSELGSERG